MEENKAQVEAVKALVRVQGELRPVKKDSENPFYRAKYADLPAVWESCIGILHKNGFAVSQSTNFVGEKFTLTTNLWHSSGWLFSGEYWLNPKDPSDPQKLSACVTYARRAALSALVGIVCWDQEDADGNTASAPEGKSLPDKQDVVEAVSKSGHERFVPQKVHEENFVSKAGKNCTRYKIFNQSGQFYTTIIKKTADEVNRAKREGKEIDLTYKEDQYGMSCLAVKVLEEVDTENVPF